MLALRENTTATPQRYGLGIQFSSEWAARTRPRATAFREANDRTEVK